MATLLFNSIINFRTGIKSGQKKPSWVGVRVRIRAGVRTVTIRNRIMVSVSPGVQLAGTERP